MDEKTGIPPRRTIDWISALMAGVTVVALLGAAWFRSGSFTRQKSLAVGDRAPLVQVIDLDSSEPMLLAGLKGKVVWIVFWSADAPSASSSLAAIARASNRIRMHRRFSLVAAAVDSGMADRVRAVVNQSGADLPVYLASPESIRRFAAGKADPPLNVLIDAEGQIIAIARGAGETTLDRIADQAKHRLDELDPLGNTRFAHRNGKGDSLGGWPWLTRFANPDRHELIEQRVRTERCTQVELNLLVAAAELVARGRQVAFEVDSG